MTGNLEFLFLMALPCEFFQREPFLHFTAPNEGDCVHSTSELVGQEIAINLSQPLTLQVKKVIFFHLTQTTQNFIDNVRFAITTPHTKLQTCLDMWHKI